MHHRAPKSPLPLFLEEKGPPWELNCCICECFTARESEEVCGVAEGNMTTQAGEQQLSFTSQGDAFSASHTHPPGCQVAKHSNSSGSNSATKDHFHQVMKQVRPPFSYLHITDSFLPNSRYSIVFAPGGSSSQPFTQNGTGIK